MFMLRSVASASMRTVSNKAARPTAMALARISPDPQASAAGA
jgi:hypothetical protein